MILLDSLLALALVWVLQLCIVALIAPLLKGGGYCGRNHRKALGC